MSTALYAFASLRKYTQNVYICVNIRIYTYVRLWLSHIRQSWQNHVQGILIMYISASNKKSAFLTLFLTSSTLHDYLKTWAVGLSHWPRACFQSEVILRDLIWWLVRQGIEKQAVLDAGSTCYSFLIIHIHILLFFDDSYPHFTHFWSFTYTIATFSLSTQSVGRLAIEIREAGSGFL